MSIFALLTYVIKISGRIFILLTVVISGERDWGIESCLGDQLVQFARDRRVTRT